MGGALILESESFPPHMAMTTPAPPAVWTNQDVLIGVSATDYGVGTQTLAASTTGTTDPLWAGASATNTTAPSGASCMTSPAGNTGPGTASTGDRNHRCQAALPLTTHNLPDGAYTVNYTGTDAVANPSPALPVAVKIDRRTPAATLSGSLTGHTALVPLTDPSYTLHVVADDSDPTPGSPAAARSGVYQVAVQVSNTGQASDPPQTFTNPTCNTDKQSCSVQYSVDYPYTLSTAKPGPHTATVTVTDAAGNVSAPQTVSFTTLAPVAIDTSQLGLERYYQYDTTPTGPGSKAYVNLANGNLVWQDALFNNPGRGLNTFGLLTYNDQGPLSLFGIGRYNEIGEGFSLSISGITRVNEPLDVLGAAAGKITLTDADGTVHVFTADPASSPLGTGLNATRFVAPPGVHLRLRRFATSGLRTWGATRPDGVTYYFDDLGYATSIQDRNGNLIQYGYRYVLPVSLLGFLGGACNVLGQITGLLPSMVGSLVCKRQLVSITDSAGLVAPLAPTWGERTVTIGYTASDTSGKVSSITDHMGRTISFGYDSAGGLQSLTQAAGTPQARTYRFAYGAAQLLSGHRDLLAVCDPNSPQGTACTAGAANTTAFVYSGVSDPTTVGSAAMAVKDRNNDSSHVTAYAYLNTQGQHFGQAIATDARANATTFNFDGASRPTSIVDPLARETDLGWDGDNNTNVVTLAKGTSDQAVSAYTFNANGLLLTSTDPLGHNTVLQYYDTAGNQVSGVSLADGTANYVSDLKSITTPRGDPVQRTYTTDFGYGADGRGNLQTITEPASIDATPGGAVTPQRRDVTATYDAVGEVVTETDEDGNLTTYPEHDANGLPTVRIDPRGNAAAAAPGGTAADALTGRWISHYDTVGDLLTVTDPRGAQTGDTTSGRAGTPYTTTYAYDNLDRVTREDLPRLSASGQFSVRKWEYDSNDNVATYADALASIALTGAAADATNPAAFHTDYDAMDQPTRSRTPAVSHAGETGNAPEETVYGYDAVNNLTSVKAPMAGAPGFTSVPGAYVTTFGIDAANQRTSITRQQVAQGTTTQLVTSMAYDGRGNVVGVADPAHNATSGCKTLGPAAAAMTAACERYTMAYDRAGNLTDRVEDPSGLNLDTVSTYYPDDKLKTVTDPRALKPHPAGETYTTTYHYDERGQKIDAIDPVGGKTAFGYDLAGRLVQLTKPNGTATTSTPGDFETRYTYDPDGYLTNETVPRAAGQYGSSSWAMHYARNPVGDATTVTDPRGHSFINTFFDTGELHTTDRPSFYGFSGPGAPGGVPRAGTPASGATTAGGQPEITQLGYEQLLAQSRGPEAPLPRSAGEGSFGSVDPLPIPDVVPRAGATSFAYDGEMRLTTVTDAHGTKDMLGRDQLGRIASVTQPLTADVAGNVTDSIARAWGYDRDGNVASFDSGDPGATAGYAYDQFDRVASAAVPGSPGNGTETTGYAYDPNGNLRTTTTPLGHVETMGYDPADRLTSDQDAMGGVTGYGYDAAGNRATTITPRGMALPSAQQGPFTTTSVFNGANELTKRTDGLGDVSTFAYDPDGNQKTETDPGSRAAPGGSVLDRVISRTFDGRDLPWAVTTDDGLSNSTSVRTTVSEFDANGDLRRTVNPAGVGSNGQPVTPDDGESLLGSSSTANRYATVREYTPDGLLAFIDLPKSAPTGGASNDDDFYQAAYSYTSAGFIDGVSLPRDMTTGETAVSTHYVHLLDGWISSQNDPAHQSVNSTAPTSQVLSYSYDHRGDQTSWVRASTNDPTRTISRAFAPDGVMKSRTATVSDGSTPARSYDYAYDADRRLNLVTEHDANRSPATESFAYDAADRLLRANDSLRNTDTLMSYDEAGNVKTRQTDGNLTASAPPTYVGGKVTTFSYDSLDRETVMAANPSDGPNRTTSTSYWPSGDVREQVDPNMVAHDDYYDQAGHIVRRQRVKGSTGGCPVRRGTSWWRSGDQLTVASVAAGSVVVGGVVDRLVAARPAATSRSTVIASAARCL